MNYKQLIKAINEAPVTYLPSLYKEIVRVARGKKALIEKECLRRVQENGAVVPDESSIQLTPTAKSILFELVNSHAKLTQDLYRLDESYNNAHYSYQAEQRAVEFLRQQGLVDEFTTFYNTTLPVRTVEVGEQGPPMIRLFKKEDGYWLVFEATSGKRAAINVMSVIAQVRGNITRQAVLETCEQMTQRYSTLDTETMR